MEIKIQPHAKLAEIVILEVPFSWNGGVPEREIGSKENTQFIRLVHTPSDTQFDVEVSDQLRSRGDITDARAKAKLKFIHALHGQDWLND